MVLNNLMKSYLFKASIKIQIEFMSYRKKFWKSIYSKNKTVDLNNRRHLLSRYITVGKLVFHVLLQFTSSLNHYMK